jgi:regulatory protein
MGKAITYLMAKRIAKSPVNGEGWALRLLAIRDYGREEMKSKLTGKGLAPVEVARVMEKLEALGLLDDLRYAQRLAHFYSHEKLYGPQRVVQKLAQRGIPMPLAREVTERAEKKGPSSERLRKVLNLRLKKQGSDPVLAGQRRKLANYLRQRGFHWDDISEALQEIGGSSDE